MNFMPIWAAAAKVGLREAAIALAILAVLVAACGGGPNRDASGEVIRSFDLDVFALQVGDCYQNGEGAKFQQVRVVPCNQSHDFEAFSLLGFTNKDQAWPGADALAHTALVHCSATFEIYVWQRLYVSDLDFGWIYPSEATWNSEEERTIVCYLFGEDRQALTGSMFSSQE